MLDNIPQASRNHSNRGLTSRRRRAGSHRHPRDLAPASGGILVVSLDGFEDLREAHGDPTAELVREHVTRVLRLCLRPEDGLVRWGDEEFMILLPRASAVRVADLAELLVMAVRLQPIRLAADELLGLTCSVGWSLFDWDRRPSEQPWREPIAVADAALALAKSLGGDCSAAATGDRLGAESAESCCA